MSRVGLARLARRLWTKAPLPTLSCSHLLPCLLVAGTAAASPVLAQTGRATGTVLDADSKRPVANVQVTVEEAVVVTDSEGAFTLEDVPVGLRTISFSLLGYDTLHRTVAVAPGSTARLEVMLVPGFVRLDEVVVIAGSRTPGRILEAPAAVSVLTEDEIRREGSDEQLPRLLVREPGVDLVQGDINDFNLNARGLNSSLNRRLLVLHDGVDRSVGFLQSQEWWAFGRPLDDIRRVEMVRGPGSALYGANAFSGVLSITSTAPYEVLGTRLAVAGGLPDYGRFDVRHAESSADGRWSYKANAGYQVAWDIFARSRTRADARVPCPPTARECTFEYGPLTVEDVPVDEPLSVMHGSARLDRTLEDGGVLTLEAGATRVRNQLLVVDVGRVQGDNTRPWARANYASRRWNAMAWWDGRYDDDNTLLAGGLDMTIHDQRFHAEVQGNWDLADERFRLVGGASNRWTSVDVHPRILEGAPHEDTITSLYGQVQARIDPRIEAVVAGRVDRFSVIDEERFSPRAALIFTPHPDHSLRLTYGRAYQTPNVVELFILVDAGPPVPLDQVELALEEQISADAGRPVDLPLGFGPTPFRAHGNPDLDVEQLTGYEVGYKGAFWDGRAFATLDLYANRVEDFITDLLPGANSDFQPFELPVAFETPEFAPFAPLVLKTLRDDPQLGPIFPLLSILPDGSLEYVLSYANAGDVDERGIEAGLTVLPAPRWQVAANYTWFDFDVDEATLAPGGRILPNTPTHKVNLGVTYSDPGRWDVTLGLHAQNAFEWAAGGFAGHVPGYAVMDLAGGWQWDERTRLSLTWTNLLDRDHYELYGGSVLGSRAIAGATVTF